MWINSALFLVGLLGMEGVAYVTHKYVMHGFLWRLHEDHHRPRRGTFEKNDLFAVFFSLPSMILIYLGVHVHPPLLWLGLGIAGYGVCYFVFHDVIVHRRIRLPYVPKSGYMKRIVRAHWLHHSTRKQHGAISFGFLYSPPLEKIKPTRRAASG